VTFMTTTGKHSAGGWNALSRLRAMGNAYVDIVLNSIVSSSRDPLRLGVKPFGVVAIRVKGRPNACAR
jgi:hypothetical protein